MKKTIWLLDFDEVLNASKPGWSAKPYSGNAYFNGIGFRVRWAPQAVKRIWDLYSVEYLEIRWATSWCGYTDQLEHLLKLPKLGTVSLDGTGFESSKKSSQAKLAAAHQVLAEGDRLVWTDDEAIPLDWDSDENKLLIRPKLPRGIRPEHLDQIERFVLG